MRRASEDVPRFDQGRLNATLRESISYGGSILPGSIPTRASSSPCPKKVEDEARDDVLVACPDARSPAYQAVVGLARAGRLCGFVTGYYYGGGLFSSVTRRLAPHRFARWERLLKRRHEPEIPARRVQSDWGFDLALAAERRVAPRRDLMSGCGSPDGGLDGSTGLSHEALVRDRRAWPSCSATSPRSSPCRRAGGSASPRC